jgi:hypothetical protein
MADYRDYAAEDAYARVVAKEEKETGFRRPSRFSGGTDHSTCLACGCKIGDKTIHRGICPWPMQKGLHGL